MGARRASVTAVAAVVAGVLLMTLLVTWAASIGPSDVLTGEGIEAVRMTPTETPSTEEPTDGTTVNDTERVLEQTPGDNDLLRLIALVVEILLALAVLYVLYRGGRWAWQTWQARRRPDPQQVAVDFDVLGSPEVMAERLVADAPAQRGVLLGGTPRNAVVEAWSRFETQAGAVGAHRKAWETSTEFTLRVLDLVRADSIAVARLAALYREARFSDHELSEPDRTEALAALDAIHASLRAFAGRPS